MSNTGINPLIWTDQCASKIVSAQTCNHAVITTPSTLADDIERNLALQPPNKVKLGGYIYLKSIFHDSYCYSSRDGYKVAYGDNKKNIHFIWCADAYQRNSYKEDVLFLAPRYTKTTSIRLQNERHERAKSNAQFALESASSAKYHPYLIRKCINSVGAVLTGDDLSVGIWNPDGGFRSRLSITPAGDESFQEGGNLYGGNHIIGTRIKRTDKIIIGTTFASCATIYKQTGTTVIVAFNSFNLVNVTEAFCKKYPRCKFHIYGDNDHGTPGTPKKIEAEKAAKITGNPCNLPDSSDLDAKPHHINFNDLYMLERGIYSE